MGKGFGALAQKAKRKPILSTLSEIDTQRILAKMFDFLNREGHVQTLSHMAIRRYLNGEGKGAVVAAPWQNPDPDIIPTHYMVESELRAVGLAYPTVIDSLNRYKPHASFVFIYWERNQPETMAACQVIPRTVDTAT